MLSKETELCTSRFKASSTMLFIPGKQRLGMQIQLRFRRNEASRFEFYHTVRTSRSKEINFFKQQAQRRLNVRKLWCVTSTLWMVCLKVFISSANSYINHLFGALSVHDKTKASLSSFKTDNSMRELVPWRLLTKNQCNFAFPLLGSYRVRRWRCNMNSNEWTWFEF